MNEWSLLGVAIGFNLIGFGIAYGEASDKLTDFSYGATFIILAFLAFLNGQHHAPQNLLLALVVIWAVRLAGFLVLRILRINRDRRFDGVREDFFKFGTFWVGQALTAWIILLPATIILSSPHRAFGVWQLVGWIISVLGISFETIADAQKYNFNLESENEGRFIHSGLWRFSRHPNYFGEIITWVGIYIYCYNYLSFDQQLLGLASPVLITYLLTRVTGIPKLESYADNKWGKEAAYKKYKANTSLLVPLLPKDISVWAFLRSVKVGPLD